MLYSCFLCSKDIICPQTEEYEGEKTYLVCLECNPKLRIKKRFKECKFSCQRHRNSSILNYSYAGVDCPADWNEGIVCVDCHRKHLRDDEILAINHLYNQLNEMPQFEEVMPCLDIVRSERRRLPLRTLAYLGFEKVNYLFKHKRFVASWVSKVQGSWVSNKTSWKTFRQSVICDMFQTLEESRRTRRLSPKRHFKLIARLIIIMRRYREDFYAPSTGNYVKQGKIRFEQDAKRRRLLK